MGAGRGGDEGKFSAEACSHEKLQISLTLSIRACVRAVRKPKQTNLYDEPSRCALILYKSEIEAIALHTNITTAQAHYRN